VKKHSLQLGSANTPKQREYFGTNLRTASISTVTVNLIACADVNNDEVSWSNMEVLYSGLSDCIMRSKFSPSATKGEVKCHCEYETPNRHCNEISRD
jgi:hypothetical protein